MFAFWSRHSRRASKRHSPRACDIAGRLLWLVPNHLLADSVVSRDLLDRRQAGASTPVKKRRSRRSGASKRTWHANVLISSSRGLYHPTRDLDPIAVVERAWSVRVARQRVRNHGFAAQSSGAGGVPGRAAGPKDSA